jgi:hypothetical protein
MREETAVNRTYFHRGNQECLHGIRENELIRGKRGVTPQTAEIGPIRASLMSGQLTRGNTIQWSSGFTILLADHQPPILVYANSIA